MRNELPFLLIVALRLMLPLAIPRYPLPGIIATMLIDSIDDIAFRPFSGAMPVGYQAYDKALDIYYLTIAYLATMRNWENTLAVEISRFLFYFRLLGVVLFESTHLRAMLVIFPNTFEYFFGFIEIVALAWNVRRLDRRMILGAAAGIWLFIKLPQEYWIHVAQLDVSRELARHPLAIPVLTGVAGALGLGGRFAFREWVPAPDHALAIDADNRSRRLPLVEQRQAGPGWGIVSNESLEKITLVSLISIIFAQILPDVRASDLQILLSVTSLIVANTVIFLSWTRRGAGWTSAARHFVAMFVVNCTLAMAAYIVHPLGGQRVHKENTLFFLLMLTLLITLYNRYRPEYLARANRRVRCRLTVRSCANHLPDRPDRLRHA